MRTFTQSAGCVKSPVDRITVALPHLWLKDRETYGRQQNHVVVSRWQLKEELGGNNINLGPRHYSPPTADPQTRIVKQDVMPHSKADRPPSTEVCGITRNCYMIKPVFVIPYMNVNEGNGNIPKDVLHNIAHRLYKGVPYYFQKVIWFYSTCINTMQ
jgi:hypothetical protein